MIKTSQDRQPGLGTTGISGTLTLTKAGTTARTATFPDAAITVAGLEVAQTFTVSQTVSAASNGIIQILSRNTDAAGTSAEARTITSNGTGTLSQAAYGVARSGTQFGLARAGMASIFSSAHTAFAIGTTDAVALSLATNNTVRLTIDSAGAVTCSSSISATSGTFTSTITATRAASGNTAQTISVAGDANVRLLIAASGTHVWGDGTAAGDTTLSRSGVGQLTLAGSGMIFPNGTAAAPGIRLTSEAHGLYRFNSTTLGFAVSGVYAALLTDQGLFAATTIQGGNGTAAAPGIRLTSEASGLYRLSSTSIGVSVAGVAAAVYQGTGAGFGGGFQLLTTADADYTYIYSDRTNVELRIAAGSGSAQGANIRMFGTSHASANITEFRRSTTVSATIDGSGILTVNNTTDAMTTSDGSVRLSGGLSVAKSLVTGNARKIGVRSVTSAAGTTTLDGTDHLAVCTGSTTQTFTLPAAASGRVLFIKNRSTGNLTVNRAGSDTIDGTTTVVLTAGQSLQIVANGTDWVIL
jgi:hypothetical protein